MAIKCFASRSLGDVEEKVNKFMEEIGGDMPVRTHVMDGWYIFVVFYNKFNHRNNDTKKEE